MTDDNISILPNWKKNATAEDRLNELALIARKRPELFEKMIIVYQEQNDGTYYTRYIGTDMDTPVLYGLLEMAKDTIRYNTSKDR